MEFEAFQPLNDLVLVRRVDETQEVHKGTDIAIPQKYRQQSNRGIVVAVSNSINRVTLKPHFELTPGDRVTFGVYNAETHTVEGEELLLIRYNDIRGVERAIATDYQITDDIPF